MRQGVVEILKAMIVSEGWFINGHNLKGDLNEICYMGSRFEGRKTI